MKNVYLSSAPIPQISKMQHSEHISTALTLTHLVEKYSEQLLDRAYYLTSCKEEARDIVQEVYIAAHSKIESFEGRSSAYTWLCTILTHKVADRYRRRYRSGKSISFDDIYTKDGEWREHYIDHRDDSIDEHLLDNNDFNAVFSHCIEKLPTHVRTVIKSCYIDGSSAKDSCSAFGISPSNYWKILQRGRLNLRGCLNSNWFNK